MKCIECGYAQWDKNRDPNKIATVHCCLCGDMIMVTDGKCDWAITPSEREYQELCKEIYREDMIADEICSY